MAEPISIQQLKDASEDAISLAEFINKPENAMIPRRLASDIHSLQYYLEYMKSFAQRSYETYDEMVANSSNLSENVSVFVTNDSDTSKNGIYTYNGTSFVKGGYQPENAAKEFVEAKLGGLEVVDGKVRTQDVSTADGNTQETKNLEFRNELDALPFDDGVLADTFVTVTANEVGAVARNQRDKNADIVSIKDFKSDDVSWSYALQKAINTGKTIYIPSSGNYELTEDALKSTSRIVDIYSDGATVSIKAGSGSFLFDISDLSLFRVKGIKFVNGKESGKATLVGGAANLTCDEFYLLDNEFRDNTTLCFINGSTTQNPVNDFYGFKRFVVSGNKVFDTIYSFSIMTNLPMVYAELSKNTVNNFMFTFVNFGLINGTSNADEVHKLRSFYVFGNTVTNDDDFWHDGVRTGAAYYAFVVLEGTRVEYTDNTVSGMKLDRSDMYIYDAYLSCNVVISTRNKYINNANFNLPVDNANTIFMSKSGYSNGVRPIKIFEGNTAVIDKKWLESIGRERCYHRIIGLSTDGSGNVVCRNNVIAVDGLFRSPQTRIYSLDFSNNKVFAQYAESGSLALYIRPEINIADGEAETSIKNNDYSIQESVGDNTMLYNGLLSAPVLGSFSCVNNKVTCINSTGSSIGTFITELKALSAVIENNSMNMPPNRTLTGIRVKNLIMKNNSFTGSPIQGGWLGRYFKIYGASDYSEDYYGNFPVMYLGVDTQYLSNDTGLRFFVSISITNSSGENVIRFSYDLLRNNDITTLEWKNSEGVVMSQLAGAGSSESDTVLGVVSGDGSNSPYVSLYNSSDSDVYFRIRGVNSGNSHISTKVVSVNI